MRCNGSGSCKNCSCKKESRSCSDCLPRRRGRCTNSDQQLSRPSTDSTPVPGQTLPQVLPTNLLAALLQKLKLLKPALASLASFTNEPPSSPPAETETVEALQHAETRVSLTPDLAAIDVCHTFHSGDGHYAKPNTAAKDPSSASPAEIVETPQHAETRVSLTPDLAAIDVTPPTAAKCYQRTS